MLRQILINLISNAVKFTPSPKSIFVNIKTLPNESIIEIKDEGRGIPADDLKNIFEPFIRAKNVGETKGNGLGLSIVKHALEQLKGDIKVKSKINEGSVFIVSLPNVLVSEDN